MTEHKKLKPEIRFAGFTDDWEQRKLEDVSFSYSGGTPSVNNLSFYGGSIPFIRSGEINDETTELFITEEGLNNSSAKLVEKGNILYALYGATSGEVGRAKIHGAINQAILAIVPYVNYDSEFIAQWLRRNKYSIISTYLQGGQGNLSGEIVKNLILELPPSKEEQTKIGNFFKQLDDTIALHQREFEKFKILRKAYLKHIFIDDTTQFRAEKTIPWEQCKLGDVVNIIMGQSPDSKNYTNNSSDHILVQGNADIKNGFVYPRVWTTQITKQSHSGDLIMSVRAPVGDIAKTEYDVVLGRGVCAIKGNEFIFQLLTKMKENDYWESLSTGSTFDSINSNDIKNAEIFIPSLEEQTQIGNFFKQLDDTIALHQKELAKYQQIKTACLEKMFVE